MRPSLLYLIRVRPSVGTGVACEHWAGGCDAYPFDAAGRVHVGLVGLLYVLSAAASDERCRCD